MKRLENTKSPNYIAVFTNNIAILILTSRNRSFDEVFWEMFNCNYMNVCVHKVYLNAYKNHCF